MILLADQVADRLAAGLGRDPLVITPSPDLDELRTSGSASVDLRLGTWFVAPRSRKTHLLDVAEPKESVDAEAEFTKKVYVPFGERYILHPQAFVLAMTLEWLLLPSNLAGYVTGKSTWARRGLIIEAAMGIHPRYSGCLTLELANVGEVPIAVRPGMPICQIFLHETTKGTEYADQSQFVGYGRPRLGTIEKDPIATMLRGD